VRLWYEFWKGLLLLFFRLWFRLRVEGREHEPAQGGVLAVCNHASAVDPPIAGTALRRPARYMAKDELFKVPVLGAWLTSIGAFGVRRGEADRQSIRTSIQILQQNGVLVMFPEGTRSADGRLREPEPGAAMIALRAGATVLPMAVVGSHIAMPKGAKFPKRRPVVVKIGAPFPVPKVEGRLDRAVLDGYSRKMIDAIAALLPADQLPAGPSRPTTTASGVSAPARTTPEGGP
jgi:1-acyl-sn-glycerol-3-phosphate acyltransferase